MGALTRAVSVGGWCPTEVRAGKEGGQAGEVCVLAGEEGLALFSWSHQTGLRGETGERIWTEQTGRHPVGLLGRILHAVNLQPYQRLGVRRTAEPLGRIPKAVFTHNVNVAHSYQGDKTWFSVTLSEKFEGTRSFDNILLASFLRKRKFNSGWKSKLKINGSIIEIDAASDQAVTRWSFFNRCLC